VDADHSLEQVRRQLLALDTSKESYATQFVDLLLRAGHALGASDLHLLPTGSAVEIRLRIDGVMQPLGSFPPGAKADAISRLKVLSDLLTYRNDVPQEGRIRDSAAKIEMRVSTFPTLHGEKVVVRLFAADTRYPYLTDLGLPALLAQQLDRLLDETSGAILITGPAGSGKTTSAYACLRELARRSAGRSIATLEDPIEVALPDVAQSQVNLRAGFDLATGLRSLLRQDPQVILVGEMRDPVTAGIALQASLTGQLVLTTFHAGSAAGALSRLADMGVEPYVLRSGVLAIVCQRLVRKLCECAVESDSPEARLGLPVATARLPQACPQCHGTGYVGRVLLAEMLTVDSADVAAAILSQADRVALEQAALRGGMQSRWHWAARAVESGLTSAAEVRRVLGFTDAPGPDAG
jgi:type II secretory ATPase GspE/PulE/Tfp pilus assembly ATPase PilB-like protein